MTDVFRKFYKKLSEENDLLIFDIKYKAEELYNFMDKVNSREMSIAKTNLEQAIMWATKAVVLSDSNEKN